MNLAPRNGTPKKLPSLLHPVIKKYVPDVDGYFVCERNKLITNKALCVRYRAIRALEQKVQNCSYCELDLSLVETRHLDSFEELSKNLRDMLYTPPPTAANPGVALC